MTLLHATAGVALALAATALTGWSVARFFTEDLTRLEKAAWSFAAGLFVQCTVVLLLLAGQARLGDAKILLANALVVVASLLLLRPRRPSRPPPAQGSPAIRLAVVALVVIATAGWGLFLVQALAEPMWATDYLGIWGLKGKTVFLTESLPRRLFQDPALYWAHKEYPLLVPLSLAALASILGAWNDQALALLFPICELATLLTLGGFLTRRVSAVAGAGAAALASLCFPLYRAVNAGTAEVPFAFSLVLVCCALLDAAENGSGVTRLRLLAAALFCVSIKQEGTLFVLLLAGLLWVRARMRPLRAWRAGAWTLLLPPVVHWTLLYFLRGPQTRRDFDLTLFAPHRWGELPPLFIVVIGRMFGTEARQAAVPLLAIALFLLMTRPGIADPLIPVFVAQLLGYAVAFSVSSFDPIYAIEGAFRRIALTLFPAFTLVLCARGMPGPARSGVP